MATESYIQNLINTNLADDSDILPSEHREVEDAFLSEFFPDSVKLEWNGSSAVDPIADIVCNPALTTLAKIQFKIYFEKVGNHVFVNGTIRSTEDTVTIGTTLLATFPTNLYKPLTTHNTRTTLIKDDIVSPTILSNSAIFLGVNGINTGLYLTGSMPPNNNRYFNFSFHYKVAN